jgi:carboxypeptidase family protein
MSGYVRSSLGGGTIANARLEILQGVNAGKTAWSDSGGLYRFEQLKTSAMQVRVSAADYDGQTVNVSITGNLTMNFELTPLMPYVYSGIVTDGIGRPVVGATVRGGPNSGVTDANGRYEFRSPYNSVPGNVYPPAGYERKPVHFYESFPMSAGVLNISIRRITSVTIAPPATLKVGEYASMSPRITFDTGQVELPHYDYFQRSVSDFTVLKFSGVVNAMVEAIKPGTASVTGSYFGAAANTAQIQVVP